MTHPEWDETIARFVRVADLAERSTSPAFWRIFTDGIGGTEYLKAEQRMFQVQRGLYAEVRRLADQLWPSP